MSPRTEGFSLHSTATPTPIVFVTVPWIPDVAPVNLHSQANDLGEPQEYPVATTLGSPDEVTSLSPVGVTFSSPLDATTLCPTEATLQSPSEVPVENPFEGPLSSTAVATQVGPLEATLSCAPGAPIQPLFLIGQTTEQPKSKTRRKLRSARFGRLSPSGSCAIVGQSVSFRSGDFSSNPTTDSEAEVATAQPPKCVAKPSVSTAITQLCKDVRNVLVQPPLWGLVPPTHQSVFTKPSGCTDTNELQSSEHVDTKKPQPSSKSVMKEELKPKSLAAGLITQPSKYTEMKKSEPCEDIKGQKSQPATPFIWMIPSVTEPLTLATSQPCRGFSPSDSPPSYDSTFPNATNVGATRWPSSNLAGQPTFSFNFPHQNDVIMVDAPPFDLPKRNEEVLVNRPTITSTFKFSKRTDSPLVNESVFNYSRRNNESLVNKPSFNFPTRNGNVLVYEPMLNFPKTTERVSENNYNATINFPNRTEDSSVNKHMFNFPNRAEDKLVNKQTLSFPNKHTFNFATNRSENLLVNNHTFNFPNEAKDSSVHKHTFNFPNRAEDELVNKQTFSFPNKHAFNFPNKSVNSIGSHRAPNVFVSNANREAFGKNLRHSKSTEILSGSVPYRNKVSHVNTGNYNTEFAFQPKVSTPNAALHNNFNFPQTVSYLPLSTAVPVVHGNRFSFKPNISDPMCSVASTSNSYPMFPHTSLTTKSASSVSHRSSSRFTIKPKYTLSSVRRVSFSDKVSYSSPVASKPRDALLTLSTEAGLSRQTANVGQPPVVVSIDQQVASQPCVRINTSNLVIQITNDMVKVVINPQSDAAL